MRSEFGYAWGKLYLAIMAMATSTAPMPERVCSVFREHLGSLNSQNLPPFGYERLRLVRSRLARMSEEDVDEDKTIDMAPLTSKEAILVAEEIVSLFDEIAKSDAQRRVVS
ncbi:MAG: hypothetical protein H0U98_05835 [Alphaproteobacteria bacterium]|nr:hypothetical protein [Alphaproteobacteria bacterium]